MTSTTKLHELYPDVAKVGGIINALQLALRTIASSLEVTARAGARVEKGRRFSQVYTAPDERLFLYELCEGGAVLAQAWTPDLLEVARSIHAWVEGRVNTDQIRESFPSVSFDVLGDTTCDWDESKWGLVEKVMEVEWKWERLEEEAKTQPDLSALLPLIVAARKRKDLQQLFPFTSAGRLCLSRCTVYPFSGDCPRAVPMKEGGYEVSDTSGNVVGRGDAESAVQLLIDYLPPNCGPAIKGTVDDL